MKVLLNTLHFYLSLCLVIANVPVTAQVLFKEPSPLKRHGSALQRTSDSSISVSQADSLSQEHVLVVDYDVHLKKDTSMIKSHDTSSLQKKSTFLVTYMGMPLNHESTTSFRLQNDIEQPEMNHTKQQNVAQLEQDSIMISLLEDSLQRLKHQLVPFQQTNRKIAASVFDLYRTIPSILPLRLRSPAEFRISSSYGLRVHPVSGRVHNHQGIDLPQPRFTPVYATADGIVDRIVWQPNGMGLGVYIIHPSGYQTGYGHLNDHAVLVGDYVRRGQVIGRVGSTGISTGPHLHYTVYEGSHPVDPSSYCFLLLNALNKQPSNSRSNQATKR